MHPIIDCCAGLDIHKDTVFACVLARGKDGKAVKKIARFQTFTRDLLKLRDFLVLEGATDAAMESTGVYWKPVFNILEGSVKLHLSNAQHIAQVPGRKSDVKDCQWIAELLQHGLLNDSFVPPQPVRDLRDLTRLRTTLVTDRVMWLNRIEKILQDANLKLTSVVSAIDGVTAREILQAVCRGEHDPVALSKLARGTLRKKEKQAALKVALEGRVRTHHCYLLDTHLRQLLALEEQIEELDERIAKTIAEHMEAPAEEGRSSLPFRESLALLKTAPGISDRVAQVVIAELGTRMDPFPSAERLSSWAGLCPGSNRSAEKNRRCATKRGNDHLKNAMLQASKSAVRTKDTPLSWMFKAMCKDGKHPKIAYEAVAHKLLVSIWHMLKNNETYRAATQPEKKKRERQSRQRYDRRIAAHLIAQGYTVIPPASAAV